jgi:hypothetical protein
MENMTENELTELRKKAHAYDSEKGRLQKAQTELDAERAARAELEQRLASQQPAPSFDPRALEIFGDEGVSALNSMLAPVLGKLDTIGKKFDERDMYEAKARAARTFQGELDKKLSENNLHGFASRLYQGDLASEWAKFVDNRPAARSGEQSGDVETVSDMVNIFINQNKELVSGGGYSPNAVAGSIPGVKSEYSDGDYMRDANVLKRQMENLAITEDEYSTKSKELFARYVAAQEKVERSAASYGLA